MHKFNKLKSAVLSGAVAVSALAAPMSAVVSPSLSVTAASTDNYAKLLQYSLYFYDGNMCGDQVGETSRFSWRDDCHTSDEVKGGFHDAGDHVKFGLPAGYSASVLGWSYYEFPDAFDSTGQTSHLKTITDYFAKYFKDSTTLSGDSVSSFVYQIGDGDADHAEWCPPEMQGAGSRKTFKTSSGASDIAAEYAAALAVNFKNFGNEEDLKYAKALFKFSTQYNQKATDGVGSFYDSWDYYDDQAWAAGWLYIATGDSSYKSFLNEYMNSSNKGSSGQDGCQWGIYSTMSWNNVSMGAGILQAEITGSSSDWQKVTTYIDGHGGNSSDWYWENMWGSARYNTSQQFSALVATKRNAKDYSSWAKGQMDYILGNSPSGKNLVVGMESNSTQNPHHRAASGYKNYDEMGDNTNISPNGHVLVGALAGGPEEKSGTYHDSVKDYYCNEVTLDYNATLVAAAAGLYSNYKTGSVVDTSSIPGLRGFTEEKVTTTQQETTTTTTTTTNNWQDNTTTTTTTTNNWQQPTTTTTNNSSSSTPGAYEYDPNQTIVYSELPADDKMIGWKWSEFGLPSDAKITKVELNISTDNGKIGTWQGAFGSSTTVQPSYWTQTDQMEKTFNSNTGTITWDIDDATSAIIQTQYGGELKWGIWWIDCDKVKVDSIKVYTEGGSAATTTTTTTTATTTTTTTTTINYVITTTTTNGGNKTDGIIYGDANCDGEVKLNDAVLIMQALANPNKFGINGTEELHITSDGWANADCNNPGDGVSGKDALAIQKYILELISSLPERD